MKNISKYLNSTVLVGLLSLFYAGPCFGMRDKPRTQAELTETVEFVAEGEETQINTIQTILDALELVKNRPQEKFSLTAESLRIILEQRVQELRDERTRLNEVHSEIAADPARRNVAEAPEDDE